MALYKNQRFSVTKIVKFDAAHRLPGYPGKCSELHGHTWKAEIEVRLADEQIYNPDKDQMLIDFGDMKEIIGRKVLERIDHRYLNTADSKLEYPSAENLCLWIRDRLWHAFPETVQLCRIRVWESEDSYAEWREGI